MKTNILKTLLLVLTFTFVSTHPSYAEDDIEAGKIATIIGSVQIFHRETGRIISVIEGDIVYQGDSIRTKSKSYAEISLIDGSTLKVAANSRIKITKFLVGKDGERKSSIIKLFRGKLRALVSQVQSTGFLKSAFGSSGANFAVATPSSVIGVKGTEFLAIHDKGRSSVFVENGEVEYWNSSNPEQSVTVRSGFYSHSVQGSTPTEPKAYTLAHATINKDTTHAMSDTKHSTYGGEENVVNTGGNVEESTSLDIIEQIAGSNVVDEDSRDSYNNETTIETFIDYYIDNNLDLVIKAMDLNPPSEPSP